MKKSATLLQEPKAEKARKVGSRNTEMAADQLVEKAVKAYNKPTDSRDFLYWNK